MRLIIIIAFQSIGGQMFRCNNNNDNDNNNIHNVNNNNHNDNISATVNAPNSAAPTGATDHAIVKYKFFECLSYRERPELRRTHRCDESCYG